MRADDADPGLIRISTAFTSIDQLIARAAPMVEGDTISVVTATATVPAAGEQRRFQVLLADGTPALDGLGEVIAGGSRLRIVELDRASRPVHARILAARSAARPGGLRTAPPPFRSAPAVVETAPAPEAVPAPEPVPAPVATPTSLVWIPPAWLRSRRVQVALATAGVILLIGIVAAIADDGDPPRAAAATPTASAPVAAAPAPAEPPTPEEPAPSPDDPPAVDTRTPDAPPKQPPHDRPAKRSSSRPAPATKKPGAGRKVRLSVRSNPAGASIRVDGDSVGAAGAMVPAGSTVKVTVTKRGYKRATRSVKVGKATSLVIKLERM
jgi:hypothetical protein